MNILFIEDNNSFGGTQIWVHDALQYFKDKVKLSLLIPDASSLNCIVNESSIKKYVYGFNEITNKDCRYTKIWEQAISEADIILCTVNPPRAGFHCVQFACECIKKMNLSTILIVKTGSVVQEYPKEFYIPDSKLNIFIICTNNTVKDYIIQNKNIPEHRVSVIYQGINLKKFISKKRTQNPDGFIFGYIGCLEKRKGVIHLLFAVKQMVAMGYENFKLLIVGEGSEFHRLESFVNDNALQDYIKIKPFSNQINTIYNKIDSLILPSISKEGLPNTILEAMAMRKLVIASDVGAISEVVSHLKTGILISPESVNGLRNYMIKVLEGKINIKLILDNQKLIVSRKLSRNTQLKKYMNYFNQLVHVENMD